jgi:hypothetical protein
MTINILNTKWLDTNSDWEIQVQCNRVSIIEHLKMAICGQNMLCLWLKYNKCCIIDGIAIACTLNAKDAQIQD